MLCDVHSVTMTLYDRTEVSSRYTTTGESLFQYSSINWSARCCFWKKELRIRLHLRNYPEYSDVAAGDASFVGSLGRLMGSPYHDKVMCCRSFSTICMRASPFGLCHPIYCRGGGGGNWGMHFFIIGDRIVRMMGGWWWEASGSIMTVHRRRVAHLCWQNLFQGPLTDCESVIQGIGCRIMSFDDDGGNWAKPTRSTPRLPS